MSTDFQLSYNYAEPQMQFSDPIDNSWEDSILRIRKGGNGPEPLSMPNSANHMGWPSATYMPSPKTMKKQEAEQRRKMQNRKRVQKCRKLKRERLVKLEEKYEALANDNLQLRLKKQRFGEEEMTLAEKTKLNDRQVKILENLVALWSSPDEMYMQANAIWSPNAHVVHPMGSSVGTEEIVKHYVALNEMMSNIQVTEYRMHYDANNVRKPRVDWSLAVTFAASCPVAMGHLPVAKIWTKVANQTITLSGYSSITFQDELIVEEIRSLDVLQVLASLNKIVEPTELVELLQLLTNNN